MKSGDSFGELALLYGGKRSTTVVTTDPTDLLVLQKDVYDGIVKDTQSDEIDHIIAFFKSVPIYDTIEEETLVRLAARVSCAKYTSNSIIAKQESEAGSLFFIGSGHCKVLRRVDFKVIRRVGAYPYALDCPLESDYKRGRTESRIMEIDVLGPGDSFGEYEVINDKPFPYTVMTTMPTTVFMLPKGQMDMIPAEKLADIKTQAKTYPTDEQLRRVYKDEVQWSNFKKKLVQSVKADKQNREKTVDFRRPLGQPLRFRAVSNENRFKRPTTHLRLSPLNQVFQLRKASP